MTRNVRERNRIEKQIGAWVLVGLAVPLAWLTRTQGTGFYALADANCVQTTWGGAVPIWADPNQMAGLLIDVQRVVAGKYNRVGSYCDPEGDPVEISILSGPAGMGVTQDPAAHTWTLAGELAPGQYAIIVRAVDRPRNAEPNDVVVTVLVEAVPRPNQRPAAN